VNDLSDLERIPKTRFCESSGSLGPAERLDRTGGCHATRRVEVRRSLVLHPGVGGDRRPVFRRLGLPVAVGSDDWQGPGGAEEAVSLCSGRNGLARVPVERLFL